jgi:hypothetical protein
MAPAAAMQEMMKNSTPEDMKKGMDKWNAWAETKQSSLKDLGSPLGKNKRVTKDGVSDVSNEVGGYSIVEADTHEDAAAIFADSPHFDIPGAYIEVLEVVEM